MTAGNIGGPDLLGVSVRGMGGIAVVPLPRVGFLAWSEPPCKTTLGQRRCRENRLPPVTCPMTSGPCHQWCRIHVAPPLLCSTATSSADITALPLCHMPHHHTRQLPRHPPYLLHDKNTSCWHHRTKAQKALKCPKFVKKSWKRRFCLFSIMRLWRTCMPFTTNLPPELQLANQASSSCKFGPSAQHCTC